MTPIDLIFHPQIILETLLPILVIITIAVTLYHKHQTKKKQQQQQQKNKIPTYKDMDYQIIRRTYLYQNNNGVWMKTSTDIVYGDNDYSKVVKEYKSNEDTKYKDGILKFSNTKQYMETFQIEMQEMHIE